MRVSVVIFEQLVPISGGGTPRIRSIIDALVKRGHEVSVAASTVMDIEEAMQILKCEHLLPLKNISRLDKNKMKKYPFLYSLNISKVVFEEAKSKPDIIIAHNSIAGLAGLLAKKLTSCRVVIDMTDLIFEYLPLYRAYSPWTSRLYVFGKKIEDKVIQDADKIITISYAMRDVLVQRGAKKEYVNVVYDGVRPDLFKSHKEKAMILREKNASEAENVVMHHGVMDPQDRPEILVDAASRVLKKHPRTMFWLIGDGAAIPQMKKEVGERGIEEHFFFSGWVPFKEVPHFISACDVGLVILPDTTSARVRVTLKGFEYWACEKPIVVPELAALKEIVASGETGLFYEPGNPKDLAEKICTLLENKQLSRRMGKAGRELVEKKYSWSNLANEIVDICEDML